MAHSRGFVNGYLNPHKKSVLRAEYPEAMLHLFLSLSTVCSWHCFVSTSRGRELGNKGRRARSTSSVSSSYGKQRGTSLWASSRRCYLFAFQSSPSSVTSCNKAAKKPKRREIQTLLFPLRIQQELSILIYRNIKEVYLYFHPIPTLMTGCSIFSHTCYVK